MKKIEEKIYLSISALFVLWFFISCDKYEEQMYCAYDVNGFIKFEGKFRENQFSDTIFVYKKDNESYNEYFDTFIVIDSIASDFYFGTEYVKEINTHKLFSIGSYRFTKSKSPAQSFSSKKRIGNYIIFKPNGEIYSKDFYKILGDSSYIQ